MKKYIIYLLTLCLTMVSCNEMLDLETDGRMSLDEIFSDKNGIKGYLNSCYGHCPAPYMDRASMTDEAQDADDITAGSKFAAWYADGITASNFNSYSSDGSPWTSLYQGIRKCNIFLDRVKDVNPSDIAVGTDEVAGWAAQAHTLRALYYLQLIKRYGNVPVLLSSYDTNHDYSADRKEPFSKVVEYILADCDAALAASEDAFGWKVLSNSFSIMTRAIPYAIKSQAVTYAASPLWADGTYTWDDATTINKEALRTLLANDYKLFDVVPPENVAHNAYAFYFITSSNDQRSVDKETIFQCGTQMEVWRNAGLPSTPGMIKSGPCPTQELVDCYEMQETGQLPILGYSDDTHLTPIINEESGYDRQNPYAGRDPRFYASIYYNGAPRTLSEAASDGAREYPLEINKATTNQVILGHNTGATPPYYGMTTQGGDPFVWFYPVDFGIDWSKKNKITFSFEYHTGHSTFVDASLFFNVGGKIDGTKEFPLGNIPQAAEWTLFTADLSEHLKNNYADSWNADSFIRFDPLKDKPASYIEIRSIKITVEVEDESENEEDKFVNTYIGGNNGITTNNRRTTRTGYYLRKFNNWQSNVSNNADGAIRLFRLAEIYLNFAESAYQSVGADTPVDLGDGTMMSARDAVNAIRRRAGMPELVVGMSPQEFEKRYRNERRVELAFEEHRYFDVRRWNILGHTDKHVTGMRITKEGDNNYTYERIGFSRGSWLDKYKLYALDPDEVNKMVEFTGVNWQNPGWN